MCRAGIDFFRAQFRKRIGRIGNRSRSIHHVVYKNRGFSFDITGCVKDGVNTVTVKAEDGASVTQMRGKQRWKNENHGVFYTQSTGIWKQGRLIYSKEAEDAIGGRITHFEEWSDVTVAANLRRKAAQLLAGEGVKTIQTITVRAADLGAVEDLPRFMVGRYVRLNSAPHGFVDLYPLMELEPPAQPLRWSSLHP